MTNTYKRMSQNNYEGKCMWKTGGVVGSG